MREALTPIETSDNLTEIASLGATFNTSGGNSILNLVSIRVRIISLAALLILAKAPLPAHGAPSSPSRDASVHGMVKDSRGNAAGGAEVRVLAWPSNERLVEMKPGDTGRLVAVASMKADAAGAFNFDQAELASLASGYKDRHGVLNLTILSIDRDGAVGQTAAAITPEMQASVSVDLVGVVGENQAVPEWVGEFVPTGSGAQPFVDCEFIYLGGLGNAWVTAGRHWSTGGVNAPHQLTLEAGASMTTGVGMSTSGTYGSYSASGTHAVSNVTKHIFPLSTGARADRIEASFRKYQYMCWTPGYPTYYYARPMQINGGNSMLAPSAPAVGAYCVSHTAGYSLDKDVTVATTTSAGAATSGLIGINLTSQSGYTVRSHLSFTFNSAGKLCGTSGYPGGSPGLLVAKS